ncbi:MAG: outer membrane protein assembly factor BamD, partial [Planctomycetota bacterium]
MRRMLGLGVGAMVLAAAGVLLAGDGDEAGLRARADAELAKKNYETALGLYNKLAPKAATEEARAVEVRRLRCQWWLSRHDEVLATAARLLETAGDSPEALEAQVRAGAVWLDRPHWGTELRGTFHRGEWKRGGQWQNRDAKDFAEGERWLRNARALASTLLSAETPAAGVRELAITGQVELVRAVWHQRSRPLAPDAPGPLSQATPPGKDATPIQEGAWLLRDIARLDTAEPKEHAARALYQLAAHCRRMSQKNPHWKAEPRFRELVKRFPNTAAGLEGRYALGVLLEEEERYVEAIAAWRPVAEQTTSKRWRVAAERRIDLAERPQLNLRLPAPVAPGAKVEAVVHSRNLESVECSAWKVDLREWHRRGMRALAEALRQVPAKDGGLPAFGAPQVRWTVATGDRGDHAPRETTAVAPLPGPGAWVVQARGGGLTSSGICLITDLALVMSAAREQVLCFTAAAADGVPQRGIELQVIERWRENRVQRQSEAAGTTDANGGWVGGRVRPKGGSYVTVVAVQGDRVAATSDLWSWRSNGDRDQINGY